MWNVICMCASQSETVWWDSTLQGLKVPTCKCCVLCCNITLAVWTLQKCVPPLPTTLSSELWALPSASIISSKAPPSTYFQVRLFLGNSSFVLVWQFWSRFALKSTGKWLPTELVSRWKNFPVPLLPSLLSQPGTSPKVFSITKKDTALI